MALNELDGVMVTVRMVCVARLYTCTLTGEDRCSNRNSDSNTEELEEGLYRMKSRYGRRPEDRAGEHGYTLSTR